MIENFQELNQHFDEKAKEYFAHRRAETSDVPILIDSMEYSFFNGGKRFRPMLCYAVGQALDIPKEKITPFAMALECIHTYSLIHDDLPCMDDDDERRGQPTNHIRFSEEIALLAGDSLLTEAFKILALHYSDQCAPLIEALAEGSGLNGMIRGQVLDLGQGKKTQELSDLINLHELKTGRLISLCFKGPALIGGRKPTEFAELGLMIGLAFQVKDDLLDIEEEDQASFIGFLGEQGTKDYLASLTEKIYNRLKALDLAGSPVQALVEFNLNRNQ